MGLGHAFALVSVFPGAALQCTLHVDGEYVCVPVCQRKHNALNDVTLLRIGAGFAREYSCSRMVKKFGWIWSNSDIQFTIVLNTS